MTDTGKVLFQKYVPKDPFVNKFRKTMTTLSAYSAELSYWKFQDLDYVALGHMNLNVDNAYFWRDDSGKLDCGVFDWGNMGQGCMGHKLWWWVYCRGYEPFKRQLSNDLPPFCQWAWRSCQPVRAFAHVAFEQRCLHDSSWAGIARGGWSLGRRVSYVFKRAR
eukprot:UN4687